MTIRPGLVVNAGDRFLAVEDVVTTGASLRKAIAAAKARGAVLQAAAAIIDRSGGMARFGAPFVALARLEAPVYDSEACPLCRRAEPLEEV